MSQIAINSNFHILVARYSGSGQWERVLETAHEWLSTEPENPEAHIAAGQALICLDRHHEAQTHVHAVLAKQPKNDLAHRFLAAIHLEARRFSDAIHAAHAAIGISPRNSYHWYQLGAVGYESGDIFLLCTDGLIEGLYDHHLVEILHETRSRQSRADRAQRLVKEAVEKSGRDNTTALVIEIV